MKKASGRAALILLAGLFLLFGGIAQAAPSSAASSKPDSAGNQADAVKPSKQRRQTSRHRDTIKTAQKSGDKADKKDAAATPDDAKADNSNVPASRQMSPEVANANAQLAAADTPTAAAASANDGPRQRQRPGSGR
ncbi:cytoskeletal protein RodZ [Bradyrhizobium sp. LB9.1b]